MSTRDHYTPGPANLAHVEKQGEQWTLVLTRDLRHAPEKVWQAITDPAQLREWAPFDADTSLATAGKNVKLATYGAPNAHVCETTIKRAEEPRLLEYTWAGGDIRWQLDPSPAGGTRLTLWTNIARPYIAMGAAGWHICLDVLDHLLSGDPLGRMAGPETMQFPGWQRLHAEYAAQFGVPMPTWTKQS